MQFSCNFIISSLNYGSNFQLIKTHQFLNTNINIFFSQILYIHTKEFLIERLFVTLGYEPVLGAAAFLVGPL